MDVLITVLLAGLGVGPHVGRQVGVRVLHTLVHDSHDDLIVAAREFPCIGHIDIGSCNGFGCDGLVCIVDVVPLPEEVRVVEVRRHHTTGLIVGGILERIDLAVICFLALQTELDLRNLGYSGQHACGFVEILLLVELEDIPLVESCLTGARLLLAYGENAFDRGNVDGCENLVQRFDTRAGHCRAGCRIAACGLFECGDRLVVEFCNQLAFECVFGAVAYFGLGNRCGLVHCIGRLLERVGGAGCKHQGCENQKFLGVLHICFYCMVGISFSEEGERSALCRNAGLSLRFFLLASVTWREPPS